MADTRFPTPGTDARFPSPGVDTQFSGYPVDARFPSPGVDTRFEGGTDYVAQILGAGGLDYAEFDFARLPLLFQDTAGTTPVITIGQTIGRANVKAKAPHNAQQAIGSFRPQYQAAGAKFDGSDDRLQTDWFASAGANCIIGQIAVPATLSTTLAIAGAQDASSTNRCWLAVNTSGKISIGLGALTPSGIDVDLRSTNSIIALTFNGTTGKVYLNGVEVYSSAQAGVPTTTNALAVGANNNNGTAASFWPGSIKRLAFGKVFLSPADAANITNQWLAAG